MKGPRAEGGAAQADGAPSMAAPLGAGGTAAGASETGPGATGSGETVSPGPGDFLGLMTRLSSLTSARSASSSRRSAAASSSPADPEGGAAAVGSGPGTEAGGRTCVFVGDAGATGVSEDEGVEAGESDAGGAGTGCQAPMPPGLVPAITMNAVRAVSGTFKGKSSGRGA